MPRRRPARALAALIVLGAVLLPRASDRLAAGGPIDALVLYPLGAVRAPGPATLTQNPSPPAALPALASRITSLLGGAAADTLSPAQARGLARLRGQAGGGVTLELRPGAGTPRQIRGGELEPAARGLLPWRDTTQGTARSFLRTNRDLLGLDDPDDELALVADEKDDLGRRHLRFAQRWRGLPVWPADLRVQLDAQGGVELLSGAFVRTPRLVDPAPRVGAAAAVEAARSHLAAGPLVPLHPALVVYAPGDRAPRLAWTVRLPVAIDAVWLVVVDAADGSVLTAMNEITSTAATGTGIDLLGVPRPLGLWEEGGTFFMVDTTRPMFDPTSDPPDERTTRGAILIYDAQNQPPTSNVTTLPPVVQVTSPSATSWSPADAVSAARGFSVTFDYYRERHARNSIDGAGGSIIATVRVGQGFANAFWSGEAERMFFGDAHRFAVALDVIGHELTHGVTQKTAQLLYQNQAGALNEAFSDIMGEMVEAFGTGAEPDWLKGNEIGPGPLPVPLQNYANPHAVLVQPGVPFPERMSEFINTTGDNGGVHLNSSIVNHAYWLLATGLPGAIGLRDAERIFYRTLTTKLVTNSQFVDARLGAITSAEELFGAGSAAVARVTEAFDAVEIGTGGSTPPPPTFPPVSGPDATVFLFRDPRVGIPPPWFLGRREEALGDPAEGVGLSFFPVWPTRPSVTGNGQVVVFVDSEQDVCTVPSNGASPEQCLGAPGRFASVAASPDGRFVSAVLRRLPTGEPDNTIEVLEVATTNVFTFPLRAPALDGGAIDTVLYADSMDFTADGRFLVYDALNRIQLPGAEFFDAWSIYAIDLASGETLILVPPTRGLDVGFPQLSQASDNFLTFDALDTTTGHSTIVAGDLTLGEFKGLVDVAGLGAPSYTGDDSAIVFTTPDTTPTGATLARLPLAADHVTPAGPPAPWLADGAFGVVYRRGDFTGPPSTTTTTSTTRPPASTTTTSLPAGTTTSTSVPSATTSTTTLPPGGTTSTTLPPAGTTTTTVPPTPTTSTTVPPVATTSTLPPPSPTTTTVPPECRTDADCDDGDACTDDACTAARCEHAPRAGFAAVTCAFEAPRLGACADEASFGKVGKRLDRARALIGQAEGAAAKAKKSRKLLGKAAGAARSASTLAERLEGRGRLSPECRDAVNGVAGDVAARALRLQQSI